MQNADLTWEQDLGAVTELLSGEYFRWFGRSTSHQLWSSAMVVTPTVRGLFGLEWNAAQNALIVTPNLPANWNEAKISGVPVGTSHVAVELKRDRATLLIRVTGQGAERVKLASRALGAKVLNGELHIPLPGVEVAIAHGLPDAGAVTSQMKVLDQQVSPHSLRLRLSAPGGSSQALFLHVSEPKIRVQTDGATASADLTKLQVTFPAATGYVEKVVTVSW
jgi:hypothetical protein